jgi:predicted DNA-binding transcriptional regulator YafY
VWGEKRIRMRYESWKGEVERDLDPLGLVLKGGIWYLVAAVKKSPRTYRVSNIHALDVRETTFQRPARFDLAKYWTVASKEFEVRLMRERATVEVSPVGMQILRDVMPGTAEAIEKANTPCTPDGWLRAAIAIESFPHAARQLLRLGTEVRVTAPPALQTAIAQEATKVAALYKIKPR